MQLIYFLKNFWFTFQIFCNIIANIFFFSLSFSLSSFNSHFSFTLLTGWVAFSFRAEAIASLCIRRIGLYVLLSDLRHYYFFPILSIQLSGSIWVLNPS